MRLSHKTSIKAHITIKILWVQPSTIKCRHLKSIKNSPPGNFPSVYLWSCPGRWQWRLGGPGHLFVTQPVRCFFFFFLKGNCILERLIVYGLGWYMVYGWYMVGIWPEQNDCTSLVGIWLVMMFFFFCDTFFTAIGYMVRSPVLEGGGWFNSFKPVQAWFVLMFWQNQTHSVGLNYQICRTSQFSFQHILGTRRTYEYAAL